MFKMVVQQLRQLTLEQFLITEIELNDPLEVGGAVNIDMVAVKAKLVASSMGQLDLHLDLYVTPAQYNAELVFLVVTVGPVIGPDQ